MTTPLPKKRKRLDDRQEGNDIMSSSPGHQNQEERQQLLEKIRRLEDENAAQKQRIDELERTIEDLQQKDKNKDDHDEQRQQEEKALMAKAEELLLNGNSNKRPICKEELLRLPERLSPYELFSDLVMSAERMSEKNMVIPWLQRVDTALESYPVLAHIGYPVQTEGVKRLDSFLLGIVCKLIRWVDLTSFPLENFFKKLIAANPWALLWKLDKWPYTKQIMCITEIARGLGDFTYPILLMVAREFGWIFDLPELLSSKYPPHAQLLFEYRDGSADYHIMEAFYRIQPQFLKVVDKDGQYPIHQILEWIRIYSENLRTSSSFEPLLKFMVEQFPESLQAQDVEGRLPLHHAVCALATFDADEGVDPAFADVNTLICIEAVRILIHHHPKGLFTKDKYGHLPLDIMWTGFDEAEVKYILTDMLRLYFPQNLTETMKAIPFYQNAYLTLQDEAAFASNCVRQNQAR